MRRYARFTLLLSLAMLWGCSNTVLVSVPPRMDLKGYGTLGIVEFASNSEGGPFGLSPATLLGMPNAFELQHILDQGMRDRAPQK